MPDAEFMSETAERGFFFERCGKYGKCEEEEEEADLLKLGVARMSEMPGIYVVRYEKKEGIENRSISVQPSLLCSISVIKAFHHIKTG